VPGRYFGSVNGNMIWAGLYLARATGDAAYLGQAVATARAVARHLGDATGVYADLQAENDVTEPLVEAMYDLATAGRQGFARYWLLAAASAAASGMTASGTYGRFFGGPPPRAPVTAWQVNGGLTLALAAAALDPRGRPADPGFWRHAAFVRHDLRLSGRPVQFTFTGRAVAIIGTIGEVCCQPGHAQVFRMHANDGTGLEQLTFDSQVNWFPHLSPDGKQIAFLSFPQGTLGHPADKDVLLRLMNPDGSDQRTIASFFGGQGTINVNSWAPDSQRFAYVAYPKA